MNGAIKKQKEALEKAVNKRNKLIIKEAVELHHSCREVGAKYGVSGEYVRQILLKVGIRTPLLKGTPKYKRWVARMRSSRFGKK